MLQGGQPLLQGIQWLCSLGPNAGITKDSIKSTALVVIIIIMFTRPNLGRVSTHTGQISMKFKCADLNRPKPHPTEPWLQSQRFATLCQTNCSLQPRQNFQNKLNKSQAISHDYSVSQKHFSIPMTAAEQP